MTRPIATRRKGVALILSAVFHLVILAALLNQPYRPYVVPAPPSAPIDMEIERIPEPITLPPPEPVKQEKVQPPKTPQPVPPPTPQPPVVEKVRPVVAAVAAKTAPLVAKPVPAPTLTPTPDLTPTPAPIAPPAPQVSPKPAPKPLAASPAPPAPRLNVHKSEKDAPQGVPTLPIAPEPTQRAGGGQPTGADEPGMGSARLKGLSPFPPGAFPSGGPGLRGSLVGCANSQAVGLSAVERAHCNERFGVDVARAPHLDSMSPEKRAAFDKSADKQNNWKAYRDSIPANGTPPGPNGQGRLGPLQPQGLLQSVIPHN